MKKKVQPEIENNLGALRRKRGFSAAGLAKAVGISRQTVYAIEAGSYIPNTTAALRLAHALEVKMEELFALPGKLPAGDSLVESVTFLPGAEPAQTGQPVELCRTGKTLFASTPSPAPWYFPPSDAVVASAAAGKGEVRVYDPEGGFGNRLLMAGCDPGISVLARHARLAGVELVLAHRNSSQALELLKQGCVHVAGTHLRDEATGQSNLPQIGRTFPKSSVAVISFAVWEAGIVMARGNPKAVRGVEDFARRGIRMVNREPGSGSRLLLDSHLRRLKIDSRRVRGYRDLAAGHLAAAWQVRSGAVDCCIATRAASRLFGLDFIPLVSERYDLAMRRRELDSPPVQLVLDILNRASFRRELESIGGYDARTAGQRLL